MNTGAHMVSPEELMAFLDGEVSASAAESIAAHLAECEECGGVVAEFRSTSKVLSAWKLQDALADERENTICELARDAAYNRRTARRRPLLRESRGWNWWVIAAGFAVAAAIFVRTMLFSHIYSERMMSADYGRPEGIQSQQSNGDLKAKQRAMSILAEEQRGAEANADLASKVVATLQANSLTDTSARDKSASMAVSSGLTSTVSPMIARTVNVTIAVKDFAASRSALDRILERHQGHFAQLEVNTQDDGPRNLTASLRIPAAELAAALIEIRGVGRVWNETQSGDEVTQQHQDLVLRLQNARETEGRLRAILNERTGKLADVLAVEQEIARVRGEIEQMEAEQKTLEHRVEFATVELRLSEVYKAQVTVPDNSTPTQLHKALVAGYRNAWGTILGIVVFLEEYGPAILIWLFLLALPVLAWRRYRRLRSKF